MLTLTQEEQIVIVLVMKTVVVEMEGKFVRKQPLLNFVGYCDLASLEISSFENFRVFS